MVGIQMVSLDWFSCVIKLSENVYCCDACYRSIVCGLLSTVRIKVYKTTVLTPVW